MEAEGEGGRLDGDDAVHGLGHRDLLPGLLVVVDTFTRICLASSSILKNSRIRPSRFIFRIL